MTHRALYAQVMGDDSGEPGAIHVGWIDGPQGSKEQKRLSIYIDSEDDNRYGELGVYAIVTGPGDHGEIRRLRCPQDVLDVVRDYTSLSMEQK